MFGKLSYVLPSGREEELPVTKQHTYVGRDKDCEVRLEGAGFDGKQFVISYISQKVTIQNLSRKCPTLVNEKAIGIREDYELKDKDIISLGNRKFVWTMSSTSEKRNPPRHDCSKRPRVSEPVRKVAVVTPHRRETPVEVDWVAVPPEKRRRTMFDPSVAAPEPSSFSRRVRYDKHLKQRMTPNRRKLSVGKGAAATPTSNTPRKKSLSFSQPLESPQLAYDHGSAFNKSITPGRFYRRNEAPFEFRGFNPVPEQGMSPGLLSGCDSFLSMDDSHMSRRSSTRISTPYPNKSLRGSTQSKPNTPRARGQSGMYFPSIQEEMTQHNQHDATPSSYFSSTSGSPRMMRAESPTILPGGSGSPFQGRRSLVQSSRSSSYGTPHDESLQSHNDSMYVNASGSSQMCLQDFEGSSLNQSRYSWTNEGIPSPRQQSFAKTPPRMRTPRRSVGPIESPGSAAFSPNASEANASGYVLLSPRGRSIIDRAFNRNDLSLQLSPQHSPARRLFGFGSRTPDNRRIESRQPLSMQVLTKSLRKNLSRVMNSSRTPGATSSGKGKTLKNLASTAKTSSAAENINNGTPKSTRSSVQKGDTPYNSSEPNQAIASPKSVGGTPALSSPIGASKRKSSVKADATNTANQHSRKSIDLNTTATPVKDIKSELKNSSKKAHSAKKSIRDETLPSENGTSRQSRASRKSDVLERSASSPGASGVVVSHDSTPLAQSRVSRKSADLKQKVVSTPVEAPKSESKKSSSKKERVKAEPDSLHTPRQSRITRRSLGSAPQQSSEPDLSRSPRKSGIVEPSTPSAKSPIRASNRKDSAKSGDIGTPPVAEAKPSTDSTPRQASVSRLSRKSSDLSRVIPETPGKVPYGEPKRNKTETTNSNRGSPPTVARRSRQSDLSIVEAMPRQLSEPDLSRSNRKSIDLRKSSFKSTPVAASTRDQKKSSKSTPNQHSKKSDADVPKTTPRPSTSSAADIPPIPVMKRSGTFTFESPSKAGIQSPKKSPTKGLNDSQDEITPPNTSVEINLRSSRKLSTKKKDSPTTPLTAGKVAAQLLSNKRKFAKSLSQVSMVTSPKSSARHSLPVALEGSIRNKPLMVRGKAETPTESPVTEVRVSTISRRSRASLVGDAVHLLHLTESPGSSKKLPSPARRSLKYPEINVIPPTPGTPVDSPLPLEDPAPGRRSSRRSGSVGVAVLHQGIRRTSVGKKSLDVSEMSGSPEKSGRKSHQTFRKSESARATPPSSTRSSTAISKEPVAERRSRRSGSSSFVAVPKGIRKTPAGKRSVSSEPGSAGPKDTEWSSGTKRRSSQSHESGEVSSSTRTSRSSSGSGRVTPPRSVEPEIVMRSSRKTPRLLPPEIAGPSTPTSALRRNARRSAKKSPLPSIKKKLSLLSPRKDSVVKKLSLDPEKPDKNKMAALIACHKKKSPIKESRPSASSSIEKPSPGKSTQECLTPLKDLDHQPEERSPEDALLDALDLSRKSAVVEQPKRPSRRLRSSTNRRLSAQSSSKAVPASPKSVKKLLFKTPLVEYEGSHPRAERSPSRSLEGVLMSSPSTSDEPMSRVFTTSPVVDFTDASGRKKIFRASPNSKSKVGGIRELVPTDESDLNIWTLFEHPSSSPDEPCVKKRRGSGANDAVAMQKSNTSQSGSSPTPPRSSRRKRVTERLMAASSAKRSRRVAEDSAKTSSPARTPPTKEAASAKSTRRNLKAQFESSSESPKPSTRRPLPKPSSSTASSPSVSPKPLRSTAAKAKVASRGNVSKKAPSQAKASKPAVQSPGRPKRGAAVKSARKSVKPPVKVGKITAKPPKKASSTAKPKKTARPTKAHKAAETAKPAIQSKADKAKLSASVPVKPLKGKAVESRTIKASPKESPLKTRRGAVTKPAKAQPNKVHSKLSKTNKPPTPAASPVKTRRGAVPKKGVQATKTQMKVAPSKVAKKAKSSPEPRKLKVEKSPNKADARAPPKAGKTAKSPKPGPSKAKSPKPVTSKAKSPKPGTSKAKSAKPGTSKAKSPKPGTSKAKSSKPTTIKSKTPITGSSKPKVELKPLTSRAVEKPSPRKKTRGKLTALKAEASRPTAKSATDKAKPRLSIPLKTLKGTAVGAKIAKKSVSPKNSPVKTRSRKPVSAPKAPSRGKR